MVGKMHKMLKQLLTRFTWNQIFLKLKKMSEKCNVNLIWWSFLTNLSVMVNLLLRCFSDGKNVCAFKSLLKISDEAVLWK